MILKELENKLYKKFVDMDIIEESRKIIVSFYSNQLSDYELENTLIEVLNNRFEDLNLFKEENRFVCHFSDYEDIEETLENILN